MCLIGRQSSCVVALGSLKTWLVKHVVSPMDRVSFRLTGGRLRLTIRRPVLLLSTIGQRTGRVRSTPIFYEPIAEPSGRRQLCSLIARATIAASSPMPNSVEDLRLRKK